MAITAAKLLTALVALSMLCVSASAQTVFPSLSDIRAIERAVVMPPQAHPLHFYDRFYAIDRESGRAMIRGVFLGGHHNREFQTRATRAPIRDIYLVQAIDLPMIDDGGCAIISVYFDLRTHKLANVDNGGGIASVNAACNGFA